MSKWTILTYSRRNYRQDFYQIGADSVVLAWNMLVSMPILFRFRAFVIFRILSCYVVANKSELLQSTSREMTNASSGISHPNDRNFKKFLVEQSWACLRLGWSLATTNDYCCWNYPLWTTACLSPATKSLPNRIHSLSEVWSFKASDAASRLRS